MAKSARKTPSRKKPLKKRRPSESSDETPAFPQDITNALRGKPGVTFEPGWGKGNVVAKVEGKIFVLWIRGEVVLKLPERRVDQLVARSYGRRFDPRKNGQLMKEWLVLARPVGRAELAVEAFGFVAS